MAATGFGSLSGAACLLFRVTMRRPHGAGSANFAGRRRHRSRTLGSGDGSLRRRSRDHRRGLLALGVDEVDRSAISREFVEGMAGKPKRSQGLGDTGANAPKHWRWGVGDREPHAAPDAVRRAGPHRAISPARRVRRPKAAGSPRSDGSWGRPTWVASNHSASSMGFRSRPFDWDRARTPGTKADRTFTNLIALGELLPRLLQRIRLPSQAQRSSAGASGMPACCCQRPVPGRPHRPQRLLSRPAPVVAGRAGLLAVGGRRGGASGRDPAGALAESAVGRRLDGSPLAGSPNRTRLSRGQIARYLG